MSSNKLSDEQITKMLNEEDKHLHEISPKTGDEAKQVQQMKDAVKVIKVLHAERQAEALGATDILQKLQLEIRWAHLELAKAASNPYLKTIDPSDFCQEILNRGKPSQAPPSQISVEEALSELSKRSSP